MFTRSEWLIVRPFPRGPRYALEFVPPPMGLFLAVEGAPFPDRFLFTGIVRFHCPRFLRGLLLWRNRGKIDRMVKRAVERAMPAGREGGGGKMSPMQLVQNRKVFYPHLIRFYGLSKDELLALTPRELDRLWTAAMHLISVEFGRSASLESIKVEPQPVELDKDERAEVDGLRKRELAGRGSVDPAVVVEAFRVLHVGERRDH